MPNHSSLLIIKRAIPFLLYSIYTYLFWKCARRGRYTLLVASWFLIVISLKCLHIIKRGTSWPVAYYTTGLTEITIWDTEHWILTKLFCLHNNSITFKWPNQLWKQEMTDLDRRLNLALLPTGWTENSSYSSRWVCVKCT